MNLDHDKAIAHELGKTVEEIQSLRKSGCAKIREKIRELGWPEAEIPATDEGLLMMMERLGIGDVK